MLIRTCIAAEGEESDLGKLLNGSHKGYFSVVMYAVALLVAFKYTWISFVIFALVEAMWAVPDERIERYMEENNDL